MRFPGNNKELKEIFKNARVPELSEFNGEYLVDMLGVLPSLKRFSHCKAFYHEDGKVSGYNILFNKRWGRFFLEEGVCKELDSLEVVVINYKVTENSFIINRIIDYVRCIEKNNLYIGRFNYLLMGKSHFIEYFSLLKTK